MTELKYNATASDKSPSGKMFSGIELAVKHSINIEHCYRVSTKVGLAELMSKIQPTLS